MKLGWTSRLQCPRCGARGLSLDPMPSGDDPLPGRGDAACTQCHARYPIKDHVLDLTQPGDLRRLTMAGLSNVLPLMPQIYENVWRPRSLSLLAGTPFSVVRELKQLDDWLKLERDELVVDIGSSTDLYARGIAKSAPNGGTATIVAIDMATNMSKGGRAYARREEITNIAHVRAPAQKLPFTDGTVDALVCGGSLNEFKSLDAALREARRVCAPNGRMVTMSLLEASSAYGQVGQWGARLTGIQFPTLDHFNATLSATGWRREKQKVFGIVAFTSMRLAELEAK